MPMTPAEEQQLGHEICDRTPYADVSAFPQWQIWIEQDGQPVDWYFRGIPRKVGKAIRIPVRVTRIVEKADPAGPPGATQNVPETFIDWILIGYEGGGGY